MIGIYDLNTCSNLNYKQRLDIYKEVGFKEIGLYLDATYMAENESYSDIISYANQIGLIIKQVHIDYKISNLICDDTTNKYFDYVSKKLKEAAIFNIPYVVAHASMTAEPPLISDKQLIKFKNMMMGLKDIPVTLCLENVRNNYNLRKILQLNLDNVKMCYDLGHAHCYGDEKQIYDEFEPYIICSHLHNNQGKDSHNLLNEGDIVPNDIINKLTKITNSSNCLECFPPYGAILSKEEFVDFVKKCFESILNF